MTLLRPDLPRACNNYYETMGALLRKLHKLGYERPGLYIDENFDERCRHLWMAGFLVHTRKNGRGQPPPCIVKIEERNPFAKWLKRLSARRGRRGRVACPRLVAGTGLPRPGRHRIRELRPAARGELERNLGHESPDRSLRSRRRRFPRRTAESERVGFGWSPGNDHDSSRLGRRQNYDPSIGRASGSPTITSSQPTKCEAAEKLSAIVQPEV